MDMPEVKKLIEEIKAQPGAEGSSLQNFNGLPPKFKKDNLSKLPDYNEIKIFKNTTYYGQVKDG